MCDRCVHVLELVILRIRDDYQLLTRWLRNAWDLRGKQWRWKGLMTKVICLWGTGGVSE